MSRFVLRVMALLSVGLLAACGSGHARSAPVCLPGAQLSDDGQCKGVGAPIHHIPFRPDFKARVTQGFHGYHSHKEDLAFSIDFKCEVGEPIVASRAGVVWDARKSSNTGCAKDTCVDKANYVVLDHGDGTYTEYYHLQHWGAMVKPGEQVCAGQLIGLCGNTGFSSGSHLHFSVISPQRQSVPVRFFEAMQPGQGFIVPEATYTSKNTRELGCAKTDYSMLAQDAFSHHGIRLDQPHPMFISRTKDKSIKLSGSYYGDHPQVAIHTNSLSEDSWKNNCVPVKNHRFEVDLDWSKLAPRDGFYWFIITGSNEKCESPGWAWSYKVKVNP